MKPEELKKILEEHSLWLFSNGNEGKKANLEGANLRKADLSGANLERANLCYADLEEANLEEANLCYAGLGAADLLGANLYGADLSYADLYGADLRWVNLEDANVKGTILEKKTQEVSVKQPQVSAESNLRAKVDELAQSLGLEIVSLKVKRTETIDL
jgi:uncharacterized protein YjbI with pentapeptide repeats